MVGADSARWALVHSAGPWIVVLAAVLPYLLLPAQPLTYDAPLAIVENESVQSGPLPRLFVVDYWGRATGDEYVTRSYRPLVSLTFALQARTFGNQAWLYHTGDLLLHVLAALLVYGLLVRLKAGPAWSLAGALLFAVHPVQTEAVASVVGRADLMAAVLFLGALLSHLRAPTAARGWAWEAASLAALGGSLLCKEYAVAFPFVIVVFDLVLGERRPWRYWAASLGVLAGYLAVRIALFGELGGVPTLGPEIHPLFGEPLGVRVATGASLLLLALRLLVLPFPLNHHYRFGTLPVLRSLLEPAALGGVLLALAIAAAAVWYWRRRSQSLPLLGATSIALPLLPTLNIISMSGVLFAERFLYLPVAGVALTVAGLLQAHVRTDRARRIALAVLAVLIVSFAVLTARRVGDWGSLERLARSSVAAYPKGAEAWSHLGVSLLRQGRNEEALAPLARATELNPTHPMPLTYYAEALSGLDRHAEAAEAWRRAASLVPDAGRLWRRAGEAERLAGRTAAAVAPLERAHELMPGDPTTLHLLARSLLETGRLEDAVQVLQSDAAAMRNDPGGLEPLLGLARLRLAQSRLDAGRAGEALDLARQAVASGRLPPDGQFLAGLVARRAGDADLADDWFERALAGEPQLLERKHNLALALEQQGRLEAALGQLAEIEAARPAHAPTLFNMGRLLLQLDRPAEAAAALRRGLEVMEDPRARDLLRQAERAARRP